MKHPLKHLLIKSMWGLGILLTCMAWWYGLQVDLTGDAGLYAAISRQMVESGDWLNLKINGEPYDQKPHLLFWLAGFGITVFGNTNFAFKLFPFLFGLSGIWFTFRLAQMLYGKLAGRVAALMTGTSQICFLYFMDIHTDTILQSGVMLAIWQLTVWLKNRKTGSFLAGFAGIGLAMLTKGPVGAVIPLFYLLILLLTQHKLRELFHPRWLAGILIVLIILMPTLFHLYKNFGWEGIRFYFIDNNFGRITGSVAGSNRDPFYYIYNMVWVFLPWTILIVTGLRLEIISWKKSSNPWNMALLGSILILLTALSIARGKAPNYLMIAIPPLIVISAGQISTLIRERSTSFNSGMILQIVLLTLLSILFILTGFMFPGTNRLTMVTLLSAAALLIILFSLSEKRVWMRLIFASLAVITAFNLFLNIQILPQMFTYQGARQALQIFEEHRTEAGRLKSLHLEEYELFFWGPPSVENFSTWEEFYEYLKEDDAWVYTNAVGYETVRELTESVDTVYIIPQKGMNELEIYFFLPSMRESVLKENYLIKIR